MSFMLVRGKNPFVGVTLAITDCPDDLDYSMLHHCDIWSVWNDLNQCMAYINWAEGTGYQFQNRATGEECTIWEHRKIIPMVRSTLVYNHIFHRDTNIVVHPIGG